MSAAAVPLLEAERVGFARGRRLVLDGVSVAFHAAEWTAVVGPNGAGKSTLLAVVAGLLKPLTGSLTLCGQPISRWSIRERARRLVWLGQTANADGDIAAHEVVRLGRLPQFGLLGAPTAADDAAVMAALAETEAAAFAHRRLGELSGGERQRVLLARAFAASASVLLLDEPTMHLDAPHQRRLISSLRSRARAGAAVISVLHDLTLALAADRLLVLADGRVRADGAPGEPAVREALVEVFDAAFSIASVSAHSGPRWVAVPEL
jgi:cobalamin transport system ATP-binding protein